MEPQTAAPAQEAASGEPQEGTASTAQEAETQPQEGEPQLSEREQRLERELREARKEAAGYRTKLRGYEDKDKSESEKATERIAELEKELAGERAARQESTLRMATFAAARKLGFRNPDLAHRLIAPSEIEFADDGSPKNVERLLASIAEAEPYLVNTTPDYGGGPRGAPASAGTDMNKLIRQKAGRA